MSDVLHVIICNGFSNDVFENILVSVVIVDISGRIGNEDDAISYLFLNRARVQTYLLIMY